MSYIQKDAGAKLIVDLVKAIHTVSTRLEILKRQGIETQEVKVLEEVAAVLVDCQVDCHTAFGTCL